MNNALLDQMNFIPKPSVLSYDSSQRCILNLGEIMNHFELGVFVTAWAALQDLQKDMETCVDAGSSGKELGDLISMHAMDTFEAIKLFAETPKEPGTKGTPVFSNTYIAANRASESVNAKLTVSALLAHVIHVRGNILQDIVEHHFVYVPKDMRKYLAPKLFGEEVDKEFPDARRDICDAGECLATGYATASIFHLMRVVEYGLRDVAYKLGATALHNGKPQPVECADWNKIITGIRTKIKAIREWPRDQKREQALVLYSSLVDQCELMRDTWRNPISHTKPPAEVGEAVWAMQRVDRFMNDLAKVKKEENQSL